MSRNHNSNRILLFQVYPVWRGPASDMRLPLGMLYLGDSLKKAGYQVEAFHVEEGKMDENLARIDFSDVLFVGVCSILTGFSLRCAITFSKKVKAKDQKISVVWGGVQPTAIPELCLENDYVDLVGMGDGEELIVDIANVVKGSIYPSEVKGLAFKDETGSIIVNERRAPIVKLDEYEADYSLIDLENYIINRKITGLIMSSRGCPFNCTFCYNAYFNQRRWRKHSVEYIVNLVKKLRSQYTFDAFSFSDDNFFVDNERAIEIIRKVYNLGLKTYALDIKVNNITTHDIKEMARYGVESVFFGTESLNPRLLKLINKKQTKKQVISTIKGFSHYAADISVGTEILMALPFEDMSEIREDIKGGLELYRHNKNLSVYFGVLFPLPQTDIMKYANRNGFRPQSVHDYANIDLNTAWSICDQWTSFNLSDRDKYKLYLTEKYSGIIAVDRRFNTKSNYETLHRLKLILLYHLARKRLSSWFFLFHQLDFFLWKTSLTNIFFKNISKLKQLFLHSFFSKR